MENLTPEPSDETVSDAVATPVVVEPQDVDPAQWLTKSQETFYGFVDTKAGRLKISALTEKESDIVRKSAETLDPKNPRGPRKLDLKKMRLATVAASVNKAYGYSPADPRYLRPDSLQEALTGEITMIVQKITDLSGYVEDDQSQGPESFFQIS